MLAGTVLAGTAAVLAGAALASSQRWNQAAVRASTRAVSWLPPSCPPANQNHVRWGAVAPQRLVVGVCLVQPEQRVLLALYQQRRCRHPGGDARWAGRIQRRDRLRCGHPRQGDLLVQGADAGQEPSAQGPACVAPGLLEPRCPRPAGPRLSRPRPARASPGGEQQARPLPLEHAISGTAACCRVREQCCCQVVPGTLGDDRVDAVVMRGGQQRDPAAVGVPGDADPRVARVVQQHLRLRGQPAGQSLNVLHLVVGGVEGDLPGRRPKAPCRPRQNREPGLGEGFRLRPHVVLCLAEPVRQQDRGHPPGPGRREERRVQNHVLVIVRPVGDADPHVPGGDRPRSARRGDAPGHRRCRHDDGDARAHRARPPPARPQPAHQLPTQSNHASPSAALCSIV